MDRIFHRLMIKNHIPKEIRDALYIGENKKSTGFIDNGQIFFMCDVGMMSITISRYLGRNPEIGWELSYQIDHDYLEKEDFMRIIRLINFL